MIYPLFCFGNADPDTDVTGCEPNTLILGNSNLQSDNYITGVAGWRITPDGNAEFNSGIFRATVQSSNYVSGVSGWTINQGGDAEFNNATFRGSIHSSNGTIGGFTIGSNNLSAGAGSTYMSLQNGGTPGLIVGGQSIAPYVFLTSTDITFATSGGSTVAILQNNSSNGQIHLYGTTTIDLDASNGWLQFGSGAIRDVRLYRTGAANLSIDADVVVNGQMSIVSPNQISFGTYIGTPATSAGYITIKDNAGISRKLMVGT